MIPLQPTKKNLNNTLHVCHEDLRVLMNLVDVNPVFAAKFLTNKKEDEARALLASLKNEEVESLYNFLVS